MKCSICRMGETEPGTTTVSLQRGEATVVLKHVPAEVCDACGEYYLSTEVSAEVLRRAEAAAAAGLEVAVQRFAA